MLGRFLATFMQGAVICLGVHFLLRMCVNLFRSSIVGFIKLLVWKCAVSDKVPLKKESEDEVEKHVLRTDIVRCVKLESDNTLLAALIQGYCGLVPDQTCDTMQYIMKMRDMTNSKNLQMENSASLLVHRAKNNLSRNVTLFPYNQLQGLFHHFKQDSVVSVDMCEKYCWKLKKMTSCILEDTHLENNEIMIEQRFAVQTFEKIPSEREVSDMNGLTSVKDCVYNRKGQLVCMFICFDTTYSDSSSEGSSNSSDCDTWDSDSECEDFIVFDSSCTDKDDHCTKLHYVCDAGDMPKETCTTSLLLTSNLYCEVSVMKSIDSKLDSFVQDILHPNLCYNCDEYHMDKNSCKHIECEISENLIGSEQRSKTFSKQKRKKKVNFKPDNELATVYPMIVWNFAYKQARKGTWEAYALDRLRFQKRVKELDQILTPVLLAKLEKVVKP